MKIPPSRFVGGGAKNDKKGARIRMNSSRPVQYPAMLDIDF
ncbi:hypothetical protein N692_11260 [Lactiplantibacillus plantarum EGD-AQ4]|nr:hypothetical protein N692_11260 [Lactiplantibacillus plantarum EGD-AQ4]